MWYPSFNGPRPPDAPLFQPQLTAACLTSSKHPFFVCVYVCVSSVGSQLSHVRTMADLDLSLPARLLAAVEELVWSTYMVAREFPYTILPLILIAFVSLAVLAVSLISPSIPKLHASCGTTKALGMLRITSHWHSTFGMILAPALPILVCWPCLPTQAFCMQDLALC